MMESSDELALSGAILVGGQSRRMRGVPKGLLRYEGEPLITRLVRLLKGRADQVFLVGPREGPYSQYGLPIQPDVIPDRGAPGGVYAALKHSDSEWILVLSCDLPLLTRETLDHLVPDNEADVVLYKSADRVQPLAALWRRSAIPVLEGELVSGCPGFAEILTHLRVRTLERDPGLELTNVNTVEDAKRAGLSGDAPKELSPK